MYLKLVIITLVVRDLQLQVTLGVNFGVVEFKTWNCAHRELALFAAVSSCLSSSAFSLAAYSAIVLDLLSSCCLPQLPRKMAIVEAGLRIEYLCALSMGGRSCGESSCCGERCCSVSFS